MRFITNIRLSDASNAAYEDDYSLLDRLIDAGISTRAEGVPAKMILPAAMAAARRKDKRESRRRACEMGLSETVQARRFQPDRDETLACCALGMALPERVVMPELDVERCGGSNGRN